MEGVEVYLKLFLLSAQGGGEWSASQHGHFILGKNREVD